MKIVRTLLLAVGALFLMASLVHAQCYGRNCGRGGMDVQYGRQVDVGLHDAMEYYRRRSMEPVEGPYIGSMRNWPETPARPWIYPPSSYSSSRAQPGPPQNAPASPPTQSQGLTRHGAVGCPDGVQFGQWFECESPTTKRTVRCYCSDK